MKEITRELERTVRNEEIASSRITRALKALEVGCYIVAIQAADLCLTEAEVIEQRMAAMAIKQVAQLRDEKAAKEFLATAYDI